MTTTYNLSTYVLLLYTSITMPTKVSHFIAHARSKGMDHQTIRMLLLSSGWKEKDISDALASETLTEPIPLPPDSGSAKDAFFHLLSFTTLYSTIISLAVLLFTYIDYWFPDAAVTDYYYAYNWMSGTIRWSIAVIVVSYPVFLFLSKVLQKMYRSQPEKLQSGVRRWLTYFTLFVTSCMLIGDVVTLLFYLLNGELSVRFLAKVLAIFVLTGMPFLYYSKALTLEPDEYVQRQLHRPFILTSLVLVCCSIAYGLFLAGGPATGRAQKFDEQRLSDLRTIQDQVYELTYGQARWNQQVWTSLPKQLPQSLDDLKSTSTYYELRITDPETSLPYEYIPERKSFQLCANFSAERSLNYDVFWNHKAERTCFTFDALDPRSK